MENPPPIASDSIPTKDDLWKELQDDDEFCLERKTFDELYDTFILYDQDKSGTVEFEEMMPFVKKLDTKLKSGSKIFSVVTSMYMDLADTDDDGLISLKEFIIFCQKIMINKQVPIQNL